EHPAPAEPSGPEAVATSTEPQVTPEAATEPQREPAGPAVPAQLTAPEHEPVAEAAQPVVEVAAEQPVATPSNESPDMLPSPQFSPDYFRYEGIDVSSELLQKPENAEEDDED